MLTSLLIFLGAGLGGLSRYGVSNSIYWLFGRQFPYGTLVINASGCFLMGLFFIIIIEKFNTMELQLKALFLIGFLGGYTTFSAFAIETLLLIENGAWTKAILNILLNVILCLILVWLGAKGGRNL